MDASRAPPPRSAAEPSLLANNLSSVRSAHFKPSLDDYRPGKRPRLEPPPPMTAAAAAANARQRSISPLRPASETSKTSPNPATEALSALMGVSQTAVSQAYTAADKLPQNSANTLGSKMTLATENIRPQAAEATPHANKSHVQTSPASTSSFEAQDSIAATSGQSTTVVSPQPVESNSLQPPTNNGQALNSTEEGPKAFPYPAPLLQPNFNDVIRRGNSLPHSGLGQNARSPSSKKHQCPFCKTEFTRHHNLKSHLLTHSQEKPYVCPTCQSRFRRLHDLKRHTKLHTGERPHVCPKCNRKFARGDALARHNKGPGGCAGRRASMGSFGGDDDLDGNEDSMEGVTMYGEPESMEDGEDSGVKGTPSIRRQAPSGDDTMEDSDYSRVPSTYPPIQGRPPGGIASGAFPSRPTYGPAPPAAPIASVQGLGPTLYPSPGTGTGSGSGPGLRPSNPNTVFAQNPLTESPKPISPRQSHKNAGSTDNRMQSPNMPHFQPPQSYNRSLSTSATSHAPQSSGPQLPPPHGLNPPDARFTLASQGAPTHPPTQPSGPPTHMSGSGPLSSHSNSLSSHGASGPGSGEPMFNNSDRLWAYVKDIENRMNAMQEEINSLKSQLATATASQQVRS